MEIPHATLKDLRSTGYFYDELKNYSESPEMNITTYCIDYALPYLIRITESQDKSGRPDRGRILRFAVEHLSNASDEEIVDCIFGLKKVAEFEIDRAAKDALQEQFDKSMSMENRKRLESAELLIKLLVNIIKMFRLAEPAGRKRADIIEDSIGNAIVHDWGISEPKSD